jgi:hypothetical protein
LGKKNSSQLTRPAQLKTASADDETTARRKHKANSSRLERPAQLKTTSIDEKTARGKLQNRKQQRLRRTHLTPGQKDAIRLKDRQGYWMK